MQREMKESACLWIGDIPASWDVAPLKRVLSQNDGGVWGNDPTGTEDSVVLRSTEQTVDGKWCIDKPAVRDLSSVSGLDYYKCIAGDLLITKSSGSDLHIGKTTLVTKEIEEMGCYYSNFIQRIRVKETEYPRFYWYILNSNLARAQFAYFQNSTSGIGNLNASYINNLTVPLVPLAEQRRIVAFLDTQCAHIDAVIEKTKASIEEYKKLKQSIITQAVTKGVRGKRPMRDSGIEWLGEIPKEWKIGKIKYGVTKVGSGKTPSGGAETYTDSGILFLRSQNVYDTGLYLESPTYISEEIDADMQNTRVQPNDVLLNITGASIGRCCVYPENMGPANVNQHVCIIRVISSVFLSEYMHYFWVSNLGQTSIKLYQTGGNREGMSADAIKNTQIPMISIDEQQEIIEYLSGKCAAMDDLIWKKNRFLEELDTYKKSLIYEYVTGKKEVPADVS